MGERLLILGATGRVGQMLRRYWTARPPQSMDLVYQSRRLAEGHVHYQLGDDPACFGPVTRVLSLWGVTSGDAAALSANTTLALEAQRIAAACGADHVLHASSIAIYTPSEKPHCETDPSTPANAYGMAKLAMEQALAAATGPQTTALRIGSVAGAESLAAAVHCGREITLDRFGSGHGPHRSYIGPADLAEVLAALSRLPAATLPAALNIGATHPTRMDQLLIAGGWPFGWRDAPDTARECATLDTTLLQSLVSLPDLSGNPAEIAAQWQRWGPQ
ncbi:NAD-dependent epimerase/dehydratase family protein [Thalassobius sp. MITS945101]|uniref:NAD-dependent epimerase/dehydratase family protein n=1 Tax=Thalassobius sp. MITS945101 TaxID=3096994 RepID=UPI003999DE81